ncbi:metallophosphoesterase family protein [Brevundimonas sp.]|uniref:metallophosphoesterase family protein n=1 Tax=Brevundimonas sp. TaxID=1871086 RepID=UPI002FCA93E6
MFLKLLKRRAPVKAPVSPAIPDGTVVWSIGDIHGRLDLLHPLVDAIQADLDATVADRKVVVFLGDYVDRGQDSRGVIQFLAGLTADRGIEWRFLRGNHEQAMLDFLEDPAEGAKWCEYGGDATLQSYGLRVPQLKHKLEAWAHLSADLAHRVTPAEKQFLENLELSFAVGDYFFAHAGARPGEALDRQSADDLMWIRRSFLDSEIEFDKIVVHGHTPTAEVHMDHRRIGIDTKAYESGVLSALRLSGSGRALIQSAEGARGIVRLPDLTPSSALEIAV